MKATQTSRITLKNSSFFTCLALLGSAMHAPTSFAAPHAVTEARIETRTSVEGHVVSLREAKYADGLRVRHPMQVTLAGTPAPVTVIFLDEFVPPARREWVVNSLGLEGPYRPTEPPPYLDLTYEILDSDFKVTIHKTNVQLSKQVVTSSAELPSQIPSCPRDYWLGFAQIKGGIRTNHKWESEELFASGSILCIYFQKSDPLRP